MAERIYLRHPARDDTVEVRTGFSWAACFLGFIWALMKRMWLVGALMLAVDLVLSVIGLASVSMDVISFVLSIVFAIYCGMRGNQWHRRDLERKGYVARP
jgi:predicted membrane chloride channel (bestrophin family)